MLKTAPRAAPARSRTALVAGFLALAALPAFAEGIADKIGALMTGVVLVVPVERQGEQYSAYGQAGSGTFIDRANQLILTNFHVVYLEEQGEPAEYSAIGVTKAIDENPELTFVARLVQYNESLDLAILKIEKAIGEGSSSLDDLYSFEWGSVERWKSVEKIKPLDTIYALGYPGSGGTTITITRGQVSGFVAPDAEVAFKRQFIKSDVPLSFGNSGGTTLDAEGRFIGVPTMITNQGGAVLGYIRAGDLASPLVESARSGKVAPAPAKVTATGKVFDAKTKKPIAESMVLVLKPGVSVAAFLMKQDGSMIASNAKTSASGSFRVTGLKPNTAYSILAVHPDYRARAADNGLQTKGPGNVELEIPMIHN